MDEIMSIHDLEDTFIEDLNMLGDWMLQYEYLLQLSADVIRIPEEKKTPERKVPGCQSGVWLDLSCTDGKVKVIADSDAMIIRGILSIIVSLLNNRTPEEIISYHPRFIDETNIKKQISTDRFQGISSVIRAIQEYARGCL